MMWKSFDKDFIHVGYCEKNKVYNGNEKVFVWLRERWVRVVINTPLVYLKSYIIITKKENGV